MSDQSPQADAQIGGVEPIACRYELSKSDCCMICGGTLGMWPDKCEECRWYATLAHRKPSQPAKPAPDTRVVGDGYAPGTDLPLHATVQFRDGSRVTMWRQGAGWSANPEPRSIDEIAAEPPQDVEFEIIRWTDETSQFDRKGRWEGELRVRDYVARVPKGLTEDEQDAYIDQHLGEQGLFVDECPECDGSGESGYSPAYVSFGEIVGPSSEHCQACKGSGIAPAQPDPPAAGELPTGPGVWERGDKTDHDHWLVIVRPYSDVRGLQFSGFKASLPWDGHVKHLPRGNWRQLTASPPDPGCFAGGDELANLRRENADLNRLLADFRADVTRRVPLGKPVESHNGPWPQNTHAYGMGGACECINCIETRMRMLASDAEASRERYSKLHTACNKANMAIMETSGEWSLHDVSEEGKKLERQTIDIINQNCDLEEQVAQLTAKLADAERERDEARVSLLSVQCTERLRQEEIIAKIGELQPGIESLKSKLAEAESERDTWKASYLDVVEGEPAKTRQALMDKAIDGCRILRERAEAADAKLAEVERRAESESKKFCVAYLAWRERVLRLNNGQLILPDESQEEYEAWLSRAEWGNADDEVTALRERVATLRGAMEKLAAELRDGAIADKREREKCVGHGAYTLTGSICMAEYVAKRITAALAPEAPNGN